VAHVELSISDPHLARPSDLTDPSAESMVESSLDRWAATVAEAAEPSLVIDDKAVIVAVSASFEDLLGLTESAIDRPLVDGVLQLLDFGDGGALDASEINKTPPLLALSSGRLARGLVRVRCASGPRTFDAIATPLLQDGQVVGSLTFFSTV
jgi:PAS domain-containing protein